METVGFAAFFGDRARRRRRRRGDAAARARRGRRGARGRPWLSAPTSSSIGAGVGGLAVAIRLAAAGHRVVVLERNDVTGGKLAAVRHGGATFDVGPSLRDAAARVRRAVPRRRHVARRRGRRCVRLDPQFTYHWPDGSSLVVPDGADDRGRRVRRVQPRRRRGLAPLRRPRPADLGRQRADVPRRADDRPDRRCCAGCARPATCWRSTRCARCTASRASTFDDPRLVQWAGATPRTPGRRRTGRRRRWRASRTSRPASAAGTRRAGSTTLPAALERVAGARRRRRAHGRRRRADRRRRRRRSPASSPAAVASTRRSSSPTSTPSTSTATCCADDRALRRVRRAPRSTSGLVVLAHVRGHDARRRPPHRLVLRRRPRRVRRPRGRAHGATTRRSTRASRR